MTISILVEGAFGLQFLKRILADLDGPHSFTVEGGKSQDAVRPWARKKLVVTRDPVVLVINSDTNDDTKIRHQQRELEYYLDWVAGPTPYKVIQFVPTIESILLESKDVMRNIVPAKHKELPDLFDDCSISIGRHAPKEFLASVGIDHRRILEALSEKDVRQLRQNDQIQELRAFIESPTRVETAS